MSKFLIACIPIFLLLTSSMASAYLPTGKVFYLLGAVIRWASPGLVALGLFLVPENLQLELEWTLAYQVFSIGAMGAALRIIFWAGRVTWKRMWNFDILHRSLEQGVKANRSIGKKRLGTWSGWLGFAIPGLLIIMVLGAAWASKHGHLTAFIADSIKSLVYAALPILMLAMNSERDVSLMARRKQAPIIDSVDELATGGYVLYLRTFNEDERLANIKLVGRMGFLPLFLFESRLSEEEQLAEVMRPIAPMVGVGIPGETMPHAGALRMYLPPDNWKGPVSHLISNARLVVIRLGLGESTMWEVVEAMSSLPPQRLLLMVPPEMSSKEYMRLRWKVNRRIEPGLKSNGHRFGRAQPSLPLIPDLAAKRGRIRFICYSSYWIAQVSDAAWARLPFDSPESAFRKGARDAFVKLENYEIRVKRTFR